MFGIMVKTLNFQPRYEAPGELRVKKVSNAVINIRLVRLPLRQSGPKLEQVGVKKSFAHLMGVILIN